MYQFLLNMWIMKKITAQQVQNAVNKGYITQQEADIILATPQMA
ncbi:MAG: hypothetical protein ACOY9Y_11045 [Bacillota bacterium]